MKDIFQRFMFLFHWVGFICLATLILSVAVDVFFDNGFFLDDVIEVLMLDRRRSIDEPSATLWVWLAVTHYPIKWILTGNKSFFPWKA